MDVQSSVLINNVLNHGIMLIKTYNTMLSYQHYNYCPVTNKSGGLYWHLNLIKNMFLKYNIVKTGLC